MLVRVENRMIVIDTALGGGLVTFEARSECEVLGKMYVDRVSSGSMLITALAALVSVARVQIPAVA